MRKGGVSVSVRPCLQGGHVGLLLALARPFKRRGPVLEEAARFIVEATRHD